MIRPWTLALLTLLSLETAPALCADVPAAPSSVSSRVETTRYVVTTRRPGTTEWAEAGSFGTAAESREAGRKYAEKGLEVQIHARTAIPRLTPRGASADLPARETLTPKQAREAFAWLAAQHDIAFNYPSDGCYARCHLMIKRLQTRGLRPVKAWSFANGEPLYVRTPHHPNGHVSWTYHVAPVVRVRLESGK